MLCPNSMASDPAGVPAVDPFEVAMKQTWQMVDPLRPPNPGTYALGEHNGIIAALRTVRDNYERARRASAGVMGTSADKKGGA